MKRRTAFRCGSKRCQGSGLALINGLLLLGCCVALGAAGGCKRGPKVPKSKPVGPMTHLHAQVEGQRPGQWTLITQPELFRGFQEFLSGRLGNEADVARRGVKTKRLGDLYAKFQSGLEERFILREDGSLVFGHMELLLTESEFAFLKSILEVAAQAPGNDNQSSPEDEDDGHVHGYAP